MNIGRGETNTVFVDVDGTLLIWPTTPGSPRPGETPKVNDELVRRLLAWREKSGGTLVIWTMGGKAHAERARDLCGLHGATCIAKPDLAVDDADPLVFKKKWLTVKPDAFPT